MVCVNQMNFVRYDFGLSLLLEKLRLLCLHAQNNNSTFHANLLVEHLQQQRRLFLVSVSPLEAKWLRVKHLDKTSRAALGHTQTKARGMSTSQRNRWAVSDIAALVRVRVNSCAYCQARASANHRRKSPVAASAVVEPPVMKIHVIPYAM